MGSRSGVSVLSPDLLALLAGCRAAPADDTPRLILADWLDENADSAGVPADEARARAQFIRVQVELARPTYDTARIMQLRADEARLLTEHAARWLGDLPFRLMESRQQPYGFAAGVPQKPVKGFDPLETGKGWRFHRGLLTVELDTNELNEREFVAWFASPLAVWVDEVGVDLAGLGALERLRVPDALRPYLGVRYSLGAPELNVFAPSAPRRRAPRPSHPITPADCRRLTRCENFALVRALTLHPLAVEAKVLAALVTADVGRLRRLTIKAALTDTDAAFIGAAPLEGLSALDVSGCNLSPTGFQNVVRSKHLRQLTSLTAYRNGFGCDGLEALAASPLAGRLTVLEIQNTGAGDRGIAALAESPMLERIVGPGLNLSMNPISDAGAAALAKCPRLGPFSELILRDCRVGDAGAAALAESPHVANLTYLDLWKNRIGAAGARALAKSQFLQNVRELSLRDNLITDAGVVALHKRFGERVKA